MSSHIAIEATGLSRCFGSLWAVKDVDLRIPQATIYGFLGPNGCGKSTCIRMLCGLLQPSEGAVRVFDCQLPKDAERLRRRIGYMTQKFSLYEDLSAEENLSFLATIYGLTRRERRQRINDLCATYNLNQLRSRRVQGFSGGQKQALALAGAVIHRPDLLLLDEPTSAVDPENRRRFWERLFDLCEQGTTILVSTHYMDEAERCHRLAILDQGRLKSEGEPRALMDDLHASVVDVSADALQAIRRELTELSCVRFITQQGARLRVLMDETQVQPLDYLRSHITSPAELTLTRASLEDVFVQATSGDSRVAKTKSFVAPDIVT